MKTIKLKIMNEIDLDYELRTYNSVVHYAYNRFHCDGLSEKGVRELTNNIFKGTLNSWLIQCGIKEAKAIQERNGDKTVLFGGKQLYRRYLRKLISKDEFKKERQLPISSQGECAQFGNRLFNFDFLNERLELKLSRTKHIEIKIGKLHKNLKKELCKVEKFVKEKKLTVSVKFNNEHVWISYDETLIPNSLKLNDLKNNRVLGIDLNPQYIGVSVLEFQGSDFKILHKQVFDFKKLTNKKTTTNKRKYELIKVCYDIVKLVDFYKCKKLSVEDLNMKQPNERRDREVNRLCNNVWDRNLVANKLKMLSSLYGFDLVEVNPAYSSFIGNMLYGDNHTPDMVAASIEIARRGYKKYEKNWFYPMFDADMLDEQWKQTLTGVKSWKDAFLKIKNSKMRYRVLLDDDIIEHAVFRKEYSKKLLYLYRF